MGNTRRRTWEARASPQQHGSQLLAEAVEAVARGRVARAKAAGRATARIEGPFTAVLRDRLLQCCIPDGRVRMRTGAGSHEAGTQTSISLQFPRVCCHSS